MNAIKVNRKFGGWRIEYDNIRTINAYAPLLNLNINWNVRRMNMWRVIYNVISTS